MTDDSGANRVYDAGEVTFKSWNQDDEAIDSAGARWQVSEQRLLAEDGRSLERLPAHRAFWFGWRAAHPETRLIK